jgi:hypothetical protein
VALGHFSLISEMGLVLLWCKHEGKSFIMILAYYLLLKVGRRFVFFKAGRINGDVGNLCDGEFRL